MRTNSSTSFTPSLVTVRAGNAKLLERKTSRLPVSGSLNLIRRSGAGKPLCE